MEAVLHLVGMRNGRRSRTLCAIAASLTRQPAASPSLETRLEKDRDAELEEALRTLRTRPRPRSWNEGRDQVKLGEL